MALVPDDHDFPVEKTTAGFSAENAPCETAAIITVETASYNSIGLPVPGETKKLPRRILHFSDGILEEYSTDEDEKQEDPPPPQALIDPKTLAWIPFLWYYVMTFGNKTVSVCDYVGENLAYFFGITSPKYQYEIDEYNWMKKQEEEEKKKQDEEMQGWGPSETDDGIQLEEAKSLQSEIRSDEWKS